MKLQAMKNALTELQLESYLAKESALGHCFVDAAVGSKIGKIVLADPRFTIMNVQCAKSFDSRGYIEHIVLA